LGRGDLLGNFLYLSENGWAWRIVTKMMFLWKGLSICFFLHSVWISLDVLLLNLSWLLNFISIESVNTFQLWLVVSSSLHGIVLCGVVVVSYHHRCTAGVVEINMPACFSIVFVLYSFFLSSDEDFVMIIDPQTLSALLPHSGERRKHPSKLSASNDGNSQQRPRLVIWWLKVRKITPL